MSSIPNPATTDWVPLWGAQNIAQSRDARVYRSTAQSILSSTWTAISFDTVRYDTGSHWSAGSPTRLTCQQSGTYVVSGHISMALAGGAYRVAQIQVNGSITSALSGVSDVTFRGVAAPYISVAESIRLQVGDYVELKVYQDSGAALNTSAGDTANWYSADLEMTLTGGPQGLPGVGVPTPVVNGQFIKGSGGAAIWSPIVQGDLPANLAATATALPGADYNQATANGWYIGLPSDANRPGPYYCHVQVFQFGGPQYKQVAQRYDALQNFERFYVSGVGWSAWQQVATRGTAYPNIFTGPWYGSAPPANGGIPFTITTPGNYSALMGVTCYASQVGGMVIVYFLDGQQMAAGSQFYANEINSHKMMTPAVVPMPNLAAGTHYLAPVHSVNVISGSDDYGFLIVFPTG